MGSHPECLDLDTRSPENHSLTSRILRVGLPVRRPELGSWYKLQDLNLMFHFWSLSDGRFQLPGFGLHQPLRQLSTFNSARLYWVPSRKPDTVFFTSINGALPQNRISLSSEPKIFEEEVVRFGEKSPWPRLYLVGSFFLVVQRGALDFVTG